MEIPSSVHGVLAARIDRLPAAEKRLLQVAAVIGLEVPLALLSTMADLPDEALHRGLTHLQAAESLYELRRVPERVYTFKHVLTREVVYESLLRTQRCALHACLVEAMAARSTDRRHSRPDSR